MENGRLIIWDRLNEWMKSSITLRLMTIGVIILILLIPLGKVKHLIYEREGRKHEAQSEISHMWGGPQTVMGPILTIPYVEAERGWNEEKKEYEIIEIKKYAHFLPEKLNMSGPIKPEVRYRGIFEVTVYQTALNIAGQFLQPDFSVWQIENEQVRWEEAIVTFGFTDLRSIRDRAEIVWDGHPFPLDPGTAPDLFIQNGIHTKIDQIGEAGEGTAYTFSLQVTLNGSKDLMFAPFGKTTEINIESSWPDPSFTGAFSPDEKSISSDGFNASWKVLHLNRPYPQQFRETPIGIESSIFGVSMFIPVDEYQKSIRSIKYAVLLITLTFLIFFFAQRFKNIRIHPIQYMIVGFALCLFYTLLIAMSEHLTFLNSYLISSVAIICMITYYLKGIFKSTRLTTISAGVLSVVYSFIYVITKEQDYALLMGSIGLLIIISIVMFLTRKTDWYEKAVK